MQITKETKLKDLLAEYPYLLEEAVKADPRLKIVYSPLGKLFIRRASVGDLSRQSGLPAEAIIEKAEEVIRQHEQDEQGGCGTLDKGEHIL